MGGGEALRYTGVYMHEQKKNRNKNNNNNKKENHMKRVLFLFCIKGSENTDFF